MKKIRSPLRLKVGKSEGGAPASGEKISPSLLGALAEIQVQNKILTDQLKKQRAELHALHAHLLLKEIDPDLIRVLIAPPIFRRETLGDFHNRFAWHSAPAKLIRAKTAEIVADVIAHNKLLTYMEKRELSKKNFELAENTPYGEKAFVALVTNLTTSLTDRLPAEEILDSLREVMDEKKYWKKFLWRGWLLYCNLLLETGDTAGAERLAGKWRDSFGAEFFYRILPLAHFVKGLGIVDANITKAALIWDSILTREENFAGFIKNKSVAIVGNGPQETGLGRGKEIDAHEVVIRFNNYTINKESAGDYGRKTTLHAVNLRGFGPSTDMSGIEYFFHIDDLSRESWTTEAELERVFSAVRAGKQWFHYGEVVTEFFAPLQDRITRETGLIMNLPTLGYRVALPVIAIKPDFSMRDIFGGSSTFSVELAFRAKQ
jgi:hypothetical protein